MPPFVDKLKESNGDLHRDIPTQPQITTAEAGGEPLNSYQNTIHLIIPVVEAELESEHRWCAWWWCLCLKLTPDATSASARVAATKWRTVDR